MCLFSLFDKRKLLLVMVLCVLLNNTLYAQDKIKTIDNNYFWMNCGIGSGIKRSSAGLAYGGNISYQFGNNLTSIRLIYTAEEQWGNSLYKNEPYENFWDVGILYGRNLKDERDFISISAGIAIVGGVKRGQHWGGVYNGNLIIQYYEKVPFLTIGIPIQFQIVKIPTPFWGLGVTGFANVNRKNTFVGILISSAFGKFK